MSSGLLSVEASPACVLWSPSNGGKGWGRGAVMKCVSNRTTAARPGLACPAENPVRTCKVLCPSVLPTKALLLTPARQLLLPRLSVTPPRLPSFESALHLVRSPHSAHTLASARVVLRLLESGIRLAMRPLH